MTYELCDIGVWSATAKAAGYDDPSVCQRCDYFHQRGHAGAHFEALVTLIEAYEAKHYAIAPADPIDAIKFRMEQQGLKPKDLQPMIGGLNRVYEVLTRKRPLTMAMV